MAEPLITIGITCYNAEGTIARAIESAFSQDWSNYEIVIVDDCSTDASVDVVKKLIADSSVARLICHDQNKGPAGARNTIIENAQGEFLVFFDDDDESFENRIRTQYQRLIDFEARYPDQKVMCYASGTRIYPNQYQLNLPAIGSRDDDSIPHGKALADRLLFYGGDPSLFYGVGIPTCSLMTRLSTLKDAGGFDEAFRRVEDVDLSIRIALDGGYFIGCPEKLFTQYATQAGDKAPIKNLEAEQQLAEKYKPYLKEVGRYHYARLWPKLRYHYFMGQYIKLFGTLVSLLMYHPVIVPLQLCNTGRKRVLHDLKISRKEA